MNPAKGRKGRKSAGSRLLWSWGDILLVVFWPWVAAFLAARLQPHVSWMASPRAQNSVSVAIGLVQLLLAAWLVKVRRRLPWSALGLGGAGMALWKALLLGLGAGLLLAAEEFMVVRLAGLVPPLGEMWGRWRQFGALLTSSKALMQIFLAPIAGEIVYRGLVYGYLRKKAGVIAGLFLQAFACLLLFNFGSVLGLAARMLFFFLVRWLVSGVLYQVTGRLYASMACQVLLNWMVLVLGHA